MKTLLLLRHAKSSWKDDSLNDHERPLNKRGRKTALVMGEWIKQRGLLPELIVSSTALRAQHTARLIAEHSGFGGELQFNAELYPTTPAGCVSVLRDVGADIDSVMLVGHNPGLEEFVERLTGGFERLPTCALAQLQLPIDAWNEMTAETRAELVNVWRPKELG